MTAADQPRSGYVLLANAAAGRSEEPAVTAAADVLGSTGADVRIQRTRVPEDVDEVLDEIDGQVLVVCGGDGSLHLVLNRLRTAGRLADVELGLVPLGTGNDLARGLDLPHDDPEAAARRILEGRPRQLDCLVDDDERICVNALHLGIGATAAARAEAMKSSLHELAYPLGALLAGVTEEGTAACVEIDGQVLCDADVLLIAICNGPGFGGGTVIAPAADPGDGWLDVVVVRATGPFERAAFGVALQRGTHLDRDDVDVARARQVTVQGRGLRDDVDGELGPASDDPRSWRVLPAAWQLRC